ncbi:MAG: hypothetical protein IJ545_04845 [Alphaproteobacteria bacterium]|nr:hypothetical protein [Alphaproteobacteria bacterium]
MPKLSEQAKKQLEDLTKQYHNHTLPDGWYYFFLGAHHVGYFTSENTAKQRFENNTVIYLNASQRFDTGTQLFIGTLDLLTVIAPVPTFTQLIEEYTHNAA